MRTFGRALQSTGFSVTAELCPSGRTTVEDMLRQTDILAGHVDAIQLPQGPDPGAQPSPVALASLLIQRGIDPVPWLGRRDRNRIALQSDLLGLRALGASSLVLEDSETLPPGIEAGTKSVFDLSCPELVALANAINEEEWSDSGHEFIIGVVTTVTEARPNPEIGKLLEQANAGARFLQIRPCPSLDLLRGYVQQLVEARVTWKFSIIVTLAPVPGAGLIREVANIPGVAGVNLQVLGNPGAVMSAIKASGLD